MEQIAEGTVVLDETNEYRIVGYVPHAEHRGLNPRLNIPLISHVEGNLYQGGCQEGVLLPHDFIAVFSLYPWEQYVLGPNTTRVEYKMYDSLDQDTAVVDDLAQQVVEACMEGPTLVHCQAGLNRSGLVAARALTLMGKSPEEALMLLRRRSPLVLCNETFENAVLGFECH